MRRLTLVISAGLALGACHKRSDADAASSRGLQVEAYDPVIPRSPIKGKLETMTRRPEEAAAASSAAPSETLPPADSSAPKT